MKRIIGILVLMIVVCIVTTIVEGKFAGAENIENLLRRIALFAFMGIGVSFVIMTGGIDLSIGAVIVLVSCLLALLVAPTYVPLDQSFSIADVKTVEDGNLQRVHIIIQGDASVLKQDDRLMTEEAFQGLAFNQSAKEVGRVSRLADQDATRIDLRGKRDWLQPGMKVRAESISHMNLWLACGIVLLLSVGIGLFHGLLITKLQQRPFVVTLCGLMAYRGIARTVTGDDRIGIGERFEDFGYLTSGKPISIPAPFIQWFSKEPGDALNTLGVDWIGIPLPFMILIVVAALAILFLNYTIFGRYILAIGRNEEAARYSGINTDLWIIVSYMICALLAGLTGVFFLFDVRSVQPATSATLYELYAIAAAVFGGCNLRGGEGSIIGAIAGTAVIWLLFNSIFMTGLPQSLEFVVMGFALLAAATFDELLKRYTARRRARQEAIVAERDAAQANNDDTNK